MTTDIAKIDRIYEKLLLIEQGLFGKQNGPEGLFQRVNNIEDRQKKFEKYIYMFHGVIMTVSFCVGLWQIIKGG